MMGWHNCYKEGWQNEIVPEAFSHPAKFARGLIRRIYAHALERGYLEKGAVVIDPFGGVALGALDAMFHGLHHVSVELEDKFVQLGQQNIDLWNRRYGGGKLRRWGTATILQGDSRRLCEVLEGARAESEPPQAMRCPYCLSPLDDDDSRGENLFCADCGHNVEYFDAWECAEESLAAIIASPPFSNSQQVDNRTAPVLIEGSSWKKRQGSITVGTDARNLGNVPTGEPPQAVIASPPYATQTVHDRCGIDPDKLTGNPPGPHSQALTMANYGDSDGQLGAMKEGDVDAVIGSPPWQKSLDRGTVPKEARVKRARDMGLSADKVSPIDMENIGLRTQPDYGQSDGQLAALPEGEPPQVDGIVASPPFTGVVATQDPNFLTPGEQGKRIPSKSNLPSYSIDPDNPGNMKAGEPPAGIVSSPPYEGSLSSTDLDFIHNRLTTGSSGSTKLRGIKGARSDGQIYGCAEGQLGAETGDTFWSAARAILLQCHAVLAPGGVAIWVLKAFVRNKAIVDFPSQWEALCNSCGFETIEVIRAWLIEERETKLELFTADTSATTHKLNGESEEVNGESLEEGRERKKIVERKSFFRRLYEYKARAAGLWLSVPRPEQAAYLWQARNRLWQEYNTGMGSPEPSNIRPTHFRITSAAQVMAYKAAGEPDIETDTQIDWEIVLITRKGQG